MRGITGLFFVMSMAGYLLLVWQKFKIRSWFVPLVTISGISLILYLGGLLGILGSVADGLLAGGVMCLAWQEIRLRRMPVSFWIPGISMICLILGSLIFLVIVADQNLIHYDNFSHWALIVKYLLSIGKYPGVSDALISFKDYPPGTAVWIYYVCRFLGHGEGVMLTAQTGMILSAFSAVFGIVRESRRFFWRVGLFVYDLDGGKKPEDPASNPLDSACGCGSPDLSGGSCEFSIFGDKRPATDSARVCQVSPRPGAANSG